MKIKSISFLFFLILSHFFSFAQCPVASSCSPGSAPSSAVPFGMGIYNVTLGTAPTSITNPTSGSSDGYADYSCSKKVTVLEGVPNYINVATNPNTDENVRVWVDLNNNGAFDIATELVFTSNNARTHTGNFTIPVSASVVKNAVLRLRIAADDNLSPIPTPCFTPKFSQVEDYGITVTPNPNKPIVDFSANKLITCSPTVQFTSQIQNGATSYLWSFGDGTTSIAQNPTHTYNSTGTYSIKLKACNANGCDSLTKTNYITYHTNVPISATCTPTTTNYCCGYGITKVTFHSLVNTSQNGSAGYEDFTCSKSVTVEENVSYPIAIETNPNNSQDTWVYIDYNNNGNFEAGELAFSKLNSINPSGNILIQTGTIKNTPLRMRIISDAQGTSAGGCVNRTSGQVEDYTIITTANLRKPVAAFTSNFNNICDSVHQFTDASLYAPTSYLWDFGDNSALSTSKNPQHTYVNPGSYTVKLKVCNTNGCDSLTKQNYITFSKKCPSYCIPIFNTNTNFTITNVTLNTLNNSSGIEPNAYGNYTTKSTTLVKGNGYTINVSVNQVWHRTTTVWVDFNQDGDFFDPNEKVATGVSIPTFTRSFTIPTTAKSGVTRMRVMTSPNDFTSPCTNSKYNLETEDYSVNIIPNNQPPTALFTTFNPTYCNYSLAFTDTSANTPSSWAWDFGDPTSGVSNTSTLQNPQHTFSGPGTYTIKLTSCNSFGCNTRTKTGYVTITGNNGPKGIACKPITIIAYYGNGIYNVTFNTINNTTPGNDSYRDYSCTKQTSVIAGQSYPVSIKNGAFSVEDVRVWIDYNNDGDFNTTTELAFSSDFKKLHTGNISIPATAVFNQPLRMRFASEDPVEHKPPTPCNDLMYGQAEDYAIIIINPLSSREAITTQNVQIYPNPSKGTFYLEIPSVLQDKTDLKVYNIIGELVAEKELAIQDKTHQLDLSHLQKGIYLLRISNQELSVTRKVIIE